MSIRAERPNGPALGLLVILLVATSAEAGDRPAGPLVQGSSEGYQGFGLSFHPGYGYGGKALGVGPYGGYPFYGGTGYPGPEPRLRRLGPINPFPYNGCPANCPHPSCYQGVGPLVVDRPAIGLGDSGDAQGFGAYSGAVPHPENLFAPFASPAPAPAPVAPPAVPRP